MPSIEAILEEHGARPKSQNPFIKFREENLDVPEDIPEVVTKYYDPKKCAAYQLLDTGTLVPAYYRKGDSGMIEAFWDDGSELQLELPNILLKPDGLLEAYAPPRVASKKPAAATLKKPSGKRSKTNTSAPTPIEEAEDAGEENEDADDLFDEQEESDVAAEESHLQEKLAAPVTVKIGVKKIQGGVGVHLSSSGKDSFQFVQVLLKHCAGTSPMEVADHIKNNVGDMLEKVEPPVKHMGEEQLAAWRGRGRELRNAFLASVGTA